MKSESGTAKPMTHYKKHGTMAKMKGKKMNDGKAEATTPTASVDTKGATIAAHKEHWVCPMGDGGESDHAGKCPKCGMDLVLDQTGTKEEKK